MAWIGGEGRQDPRSGPSGGQLGRAIARRGIGHADHVDEDAERGGLRIWTVPAPLGWDYQKYNANSELIRELLSRANAESVIVPYRANRAVIFDSNLFHETHYPRFKDGYLNRRINTALLYGMRERSHEGGATPPPTR